MRRARRAPRLFGGEAVSLRDFFEKERSASASGASSRPGRRRKSAGASRRARVRDAVITHNSLVRFRERFSTFVSTRTQEGRNAKKTQMNGRSDSFPPPSSAAARLPRTPRRARALDAARAHSRAHAHARRRVPPRASSPARFGFEVSSASPNANGNGHLFRGLVRFLRRHGGAARGRRDRWGDGVRG